MYNYLIEKKLSPLNALKKKICLLEILKLWSILCRGCFSKSTPSPACDANSRCLRSEWTQRKTGMNHSSLELNLKKNSGFKINFMHWLFIVHAVLVLLSKLRRNFVYDLHMYIFIEQWNNVKLSYDSKNVNNRLQKTWLGHTTFLSGHWHWPLTHSYFKC